MKRIQSSKSRLRTGLSLALVLAALTPLVLLMAAESKSEKAVKTEKSPARSTQTDASNKKLNAPPKKLSGAELYSMHCNRCHPERYPTERTAAQWKTILLHMRVRANLPAEHAREILKYLQDNSGR